MRRVMIDKIIGQPVEIARTDVAPVYLQSAFEQLAGAGADHVACGFHRHRGQALAVENEIERVDEVGRRVDQRAIQIEYDRRVRVHGGSLPAPGRSRKWGDAVSCNAGDPAENSRISLFLTMKRR